MYSIHNCAIWSEGTFSECIHTFLNLKKGVKSDLNGPHPEIFWHMAEEELCWFSYALVQI